MRVLAYKLVKHDYDKKSLNDVFTVNVLKDKNFEWNEEENRSHPINEELSAHDYVFSILNIDNVRDEYGYCFVNEKILDGGNYLYTLDGFILDECLPEMFVKKFAKIVVLFLNQYHRNKVEDIYRTDRITGLGIQHIPLAPQFLKKTQLDISSAIVRSFIASRDGVTPLTHDEEKRLQEIADSYFLWTTCI